MDFFKSLSKYVFREYLMHIPSRRIRMYFVRWFCQSVGRDTFVGMKADFRGTKGHISIGSNCVINPSVILDGRGGFLKIGNNVDIGQNSNIWTEEHDPNDDNHGVKGTGVIIEDYVWIATNVTILPGVKIGKGAVIACNSVVTKDVEPMAIMGGIPAKRIGTRENKLTYKLNYQPMFI